MILSDTHEIVTFLLLNYSLLLELQSKFDFFIIFHCFHPWCPDGRASERAGGRVGGRREIVCPGCISETVRCRKLILGRDIG